MGVTTKILENVLDNIDSIPYKNVKELFANIISYLLNSHYITKEDKSYLEKLSQNSKFIEYVIFESKDYEDLKQQFKIYKDSLATSTEKYETDILLKHLKIIISKHEIMENAERFSKALKDVENRANKQASARIKKLDRTIEEKLTKSNEMMGEIAENSNAKKYFDYAEKNRKAAKGLFWVSIVIMAIVASGAICQLWNIENIDTIKLWLRIPLGFLILLPAFFMMRESKKLKDKEFQYTDMAYRIVTSDPYIDGLNLPSDEKAKLKADLVKNFFGRPIECRDDGGLPPIESICEIIKACLNSCRKD